MHDKTSHIVDLLLQTWGLDVSAYDESYLIKSINKRIKETSEKNFESYCKLILENRIEADVLCNLLNNSYTELFRNSLTFSYLEHVVLPSLIAKKKSCGQKEIRIWSAACASGHEAYSIAMICDELIKAFEYPISIRIFATDNNSEELVKAKQAKFKALSISNISLKRCEEYLKLDGGEYRLIKRIKDMVDVSFFDLMSEENSCPPASIFGNFDVVFCSNILFYYKPEFRIKIVEKVKHCMADNAYFVTGEAEVDIVKKLHFRECFTGSAVFKT
jgi:chemotaxis methyl-accepting protein methylase